MAASKSTPIIVGVGEVCDKAFDPANPAEPADLMLSAIRLAIQDTKLKESDIVSNLDDISIVPPWTWPYNDLPGLVAEKLGSSARHRVMGTHNGSQPAFFCDEAARRISLGKSKLAVIAGGETLASRECDVGCFENGAHGLADRPCSSGGLSESWTSASTRLDHSRRCSRQSN